MLLINCPFCGERPELEFSYGGEGARARPSQPELLDDDAWAEYLYMRSNPRGAHVERWRHSHGCGRFFLARRNTVTDIFETTWPTGTPAP